MGPQTNSLRSSGQCSVCMCGVEGSTKMPWMDYTGGWGVHDKIRVLIFKKIAVFITVIGLNKGCCKLLLSMYLL